MGRAESKFNIKMEDKAFTKYWCEGPSVLYVMEGGIEVILTAPDMRELAIAWRKITGTVLNERDVTIMVFGSRKNATPVEVKPAQNGIAGLVWVYHAESDCVFVDIRAKVDGVDLEEIGPAVEFTTLEAKKALMAKGWSRADTKEVTIQEGYDNIPF